MSPEAFELLKKAENSDSLGAFQVAANFYKAASLADPTSTEALNGLGSMALKLRYLGEAERHLKASLSIDPAQAVTNRLLGQVEFALRKHAEAKDYFIAALKYDPSDNEAATHLEETNTYLKISQDPDYSKSSASPWRENDWIWAEKSGNSDIVVIFSGLGVTDDPPTFVFHHFLRDYTHVDKLFIRDLDKLWYLKRIGEEFVGVAEIAAFIKQKTSHNRHVVFLGCSAGATAALTYSRFIHPNRVVAFAPQSALNSAKELECNDFRWPLYIERLRHQKIDEKYLDLRALGPFADPIEIHFSADCSQDSQHALRISGRDVKRVSHEGSGHVVAMHLRDTGQLKGIIDAAFDQET